MNKHTRKGLLLVLALLLLATAADMHVRLDHQRRIIRPQEAAALHDAPPLVAFTTIAFGGLRGILADVLWIRATRLQMEGRYFEIVQLTDWITQLEPGTSEVWAFSAWNLAYNISVFFSEPEDRWRWVRNALVLLRDRALTYNPGTASLYFELGWLFQHKLGSTTDSAHSYYQEAWASEMTRLLGGARPDETAPPDPDALKAYRLELARMREIEHQHGAIDWRSPHAHAIYWARQGYEKASRHVDRLRLMQMIMQSQAALFMGHYNPHQPLGPDNLPRLELLPHTLDIFQWATEELPDAKLILKRHESLLRFHEDLQKALPYLETAGTLPE